VLGCMLHVAQLQLWYGIDKIRGIAEAQLTRNVLPQSDNFSGKWALVTGSHRDIGLAVAEASSREGAKVILTCEPTQQEDLQKVLQLQSAASAILRLESGLARSPSHAWDA
jgi:hypothetical protein